ncbi:UbiA family prenyltransferase [Roseomonas xinghualingensis]|uniref:UbiA family prenyltransferase n=1 Tax=Roseomonas xinghualingensis TaxID=2986475 RepID=UPI0021F0D8F9|nr:UbiA family prenyltransferase [Roseomonas sp. SXEYE001]MCV4209826.1 UbiA family prenyltransferase [Roseomonas sp. SXEYE001]
MDTVPTTSAPPCIAVDIDGSLLLTDTLHESLIVLLRRRPLLLFLLPIWLLSGKAHFKRQLASHIMPDIARLPANEAFLSWLQERRAEGASLHLFSAADERIAQAVAERFGIFDTATGTSGTVNLSGESKRAAIEALLGPGAIYAGDSRKDLPVWMGCGSAVLIGRTARLRSALKVLGPRVQVVAAFDTPRFDFGIWQRALRLHQWVKNVLLFVPLLLGGRILQELPQALLGFAVFGLIASATYLVNDLLDLEHDRQHRTKRHRPLASGALPLKDAIVAIPLLFLAATALTAFLSPAFAAVTALYVVVTLSYSLAIKQMLVLDVITLAGLFTIRIGAGIAAVGNPVSPWLLAFSMFFFLSLACVKRHTECLAVMERGSSQVPGRAYRGTDATWLMAVGAGSAFTALSTFFIFLVGNESPILTYPAPQWMWFICVIIGYWLLRVWALAARGEMQDDPVLFTVKDRLSLFLAALIVLLILMARNWGE